jgi:Fe-S-cluster containining protein
MHEPSLTRKEAIWLACKQKRCCYTAVVLPTGRDIWRISRALDMPPWAFLVYFLPPKPGPDAFALDRSGRVYRLALAKQPGRRKKSLPPCIFLMRTRNGYHRCGLGELRPMVCRTFPAEMRAGVLCLRNDGGCTCRHWSLADADIAEEAALLEQQQADYVEYCAVVARWNSMVTDAPDETAFTFFDFCNFLLKAYDELEAARPTQPAQPMGSVEVEPVRVVAGRDSAEGTEGSEEGTL